MNRALLIFAYLLLSACEYYRGCARIKDGHYAGYALVLYQTPNKDGYAEIFVLPVCDDRSVVRKNPGTQMEKLDFSEGISEWLSVDTSAFSVITAKTQKMRLDPDKSYSDSIHACMVYIDFRNADNILPDVTIDERKSSSRELHFAEGGRFRFQYYVTAGLKIDSLQVF